jgi:DNA-binding transcriptional MerR regulator
MRAQYVSLPELVELLNVEYHRIYWTVRTGNLVHPQRSGKARLFTERDVETLRKHFEQEGATC